MATLELFKHFHSFKGNPDLDRVMDTVRRGACRRLGSSKRRGRRRARADDALTATTAHRIASGRRGGRALQLQRVPQYLHRSRELRDEMIVLEDRASKLAKKAIRMQRKRQEDEVQEEVERRKFLDQDKVLAAKVVEP